MKKLLSILFVLYAAVAAAAAARPGIVPRPVRQTFGEGAFVIGGGTVITAPGDLADYFRMRIGEAEAAGDAGDANAIVVTVDGAAALPAEGYELRVGPQAIHIKARDRNGAVYAIETLAQMIDSGRRVACGTVADHPRFPYRGMHLDVARTFTDKATVMRYIDNMAHHKLNKFHWHLVDDEGWRIEIESCPRLTSVGAWRGGGLPVKHVYGAWDEEYGGFYTQDDVREVVAYAAFRGIEVIPEIDLPGHSRAAAKAYPEILCGGPFDTVPSHDDRRNVWCAAREENYEMLDRILGEVAALFPSEYIHVGGDEVDPAQWEACPECGRLVREHSAAWLNGRFMNRVGEILARHGKRQAVWNEAIGGGNLAADALVCGWENVEVCREAVRAGYRTVLMPSQYLYFDMRQGDGEPGMTWAGTVTLEKAYSFEPADLIPADGMRNVAGVGGAFWTEVYLAHPHEFLDRQTYPRICALAEVAWTPREGRDWDDFSARMNGWHYRRLADWGIAFRLDPPVERREGDRIVITHPVEGALIYSTADGTEPDLGSFAGSEVRINMADEVNRSRVFRLNARLGTGLSPTVYLKDYREPVITPAYRVTGSLRAQAAYPFAKAEDNDPRTHARTTTTGSPGDRFVWTFAAPVDASAITVKTGSNHMARYVVPSGRVEVSYDGATFETAEPEFHVSATIRPRPGLRAIRLTVTSEDNGEAFIVIQDLKIVR